MEEIEFSIFQHGPGALENLHALMEQFEQKHGIHVRLNILPFSGAWARMMEMALYQHGPDISEVGSTWLGDFERMNALRPFTPAEVRSLGGSDAFLPASWLSGTASGERAGSPRTVWAIPWVTDTRVIFYRRDVLEQAGIDEAEAFTSHEALMNTLARIQEKGKLPPLSIPSQRSRITLHNLASWIWKEEGGFLSPDGKKLLFDLPPARRGMRQYFSLARYLTQETQGLDDSQAGQVFMQGRAAVTVSGQWLVFGLNADPLVERETRVSRVPGVSFAGGFHLVIWQYSTKTPAALKLVDFLAGNNPPESVYPGVGLPVRVEHIKTTPIRQQPLFKEIIEVLDGARAFPSGHMWGLIEKQLADMIPNIWRDVLALPDRGDEAAIDAILDRYISPLAHRLKVMFG
ncbi:MAG: extracellular solute-binding protein [Anaerolineales bacterium]|nr:extracellular solute-binding protein [Anaerolineales bacterium]